MGIIKPDRIAVKPRDRTVARPAGHGRCACSGMTGHARAAAVALALGLTLAGAGGPALAWSGEAPASGAAGLAGASDRAGAAWMLVDDKEKGGKRAKDDDRKEAKAEHAPPRPARQPAARVEPAA